MLTLLLYFRVMLSNLGTYCFDREVGERYFISPCYWFPGLVLRLMSG